MRTNPFDDIYIKINSNYDDKLNVGEVPKCLDIEVTNSCNFRCLMCPTGNGLSTRRKGLMSIDLFKKIIDKIAPYKIPLRFIRCGEPTFHPQFIEFIKIAKQNDILCHLNTNGSMLTKNFINILIASKLDSIKISFQGAGEESYNRIRNTVSYQRICQSVKDLFEIRKDNLKPYIHISTTLTNETESEIKKFKETFSEISDLVTVGKTVLDYIDIDKTNLNYKEKKILADLISKESVNKVHPHCPEVFDKLSINWDGTVSACCWDYDNFMTIGDLEQNTIKEIWNGDKINSFRKILFDMQHDKLPLCKNCYDYIELKH